MADKLDQFLQPAERVLYHEPPGWNPRVFWPIALAGPLVAGAFALGFLDRATLTVMAGLVFLCVAWGFHMAFLVQGRSRESLLTDRRVLHKATRDGGEIVTAIPLADVAAVDLVDAIFSLTVKIARRGGQETPLRELRRAEDFASALAEQAKLPRPPWIGCLEHLALYCTLFGGLTFACYFQVLFIRFALPSDTLPLYAQIPLLILGPTIVLALAAWLGTHLAALVAVALMPLFASAEEAGNWLRMRPQGRLAGWTLWKHPLYSRLAGLVYDRPLAPADKGAERHGG